MAGTRKDIASLGTWSDEMIWFALAVANAQSKPLDDRGSWRYLAAIHGINPQGWIDQGIVPANTSAPSSAEWDALFNQCQHAGWFFLPWHRGYLAAFEAILAEWIADQGGPNDWALPYWNYLDHTNANARVLPDEFTDTNLPAHPAVPVGTLNPLAQARRGPATQLGPQSWIPADINLNAQTNETLYTSVPGGLGYGGPISGFDQQGNAGGALESNPHNFVHVMIGGNTPGNPPGWMSDPDFAALDPIFWVHHCNIDRLWAAWMGDVSHVQESSSPWRNGPFPRQFMMPTPSGGLEIFIPADTLPGERLEPTYDSLHSGTAIASVGAGGGAVATTTGANSGTSSLLGANAAAIEVESSAVTTHVAVPAQPIDPGASPTSGRVCLNIEGVRGEAASGVLTVELLLPERGQDVLVSETVAFFGLASASATSGAHAGRGLSATIDITQALGSGLTGDDGEERQLEIRLSQPEGSAKVTVDRVSVYDAD